ncbi:type 1 glutamine amidotransferase [candidate division GN15 bacterium]|nr:type 1 glutamine amidotransferase [candidate division GN15 bacterium]
MPRRMSARLPCRSLRGNLSDRPRFTDAYTPGPGPARAFSFREEPVKPVVIIQNCEVESPGTIADYLRERKRPFHVVRSFAGERLPDTDEFSALIVLGTPLSVTEYRKHDYLVDLFSLMTRAMRKDKPILGLCFGAQLLAHALGAKVQPNKVKEIGVMPVSLTDDGAADPLFEGFEKNFDVFQWHGDTFRIPFDASWLTTSQDCKYQGFRKGNLAGLQFHLEAGADEVPLWCDAYAGELEEEGLQKDDIVAAAGANAENARALTYRLLDNYFRLIES